MVIPFNILNFKHASYKRADLINGSWHRNKWLNILKLVFSTVMWKLTANNFKTSFKKIEPRVEEIIQKLSTLFAFVKVPGSIPSYHMAA